MDSEKKTKIISLVIFAIVLLLFFKGCGAFIHAFNEAGRDSDNDGFTDSFEEEHDALDKDNVDWNVDLKDLMD